MKLLRLKRRTQYINKNMYLKKRQIAHSVANGGAVILNGTNSFIQW